VSLLVMFLSIVTAGVLWILVTSHVEGSNWEQTTSAAGWSRRKDLRGVVHNNQMWIMGGYDGARKNDVWSSSNGVSWTQATSAAGWSGRYYHTSVAFNNRIWVMGGTSSTDTRLNDVWSTTDGVSWSRATAAAGWSVRERHCSVAYSDRMWVIGGWDGSNRLNDVWSSFGGTSWTQVTAAAGWSSRYLFTAETFNGLLWVMGGYAGSAKSDVWSSIDGASWTQVTPAAAWSGRYDLTSGVYNDMVMWVMGGYDNSNRLHDVWSSSDGVSWTQNTPAADWSARYAHTSMVYNDRLWVMGGYTNDVVDSGRVNDVWSVNLLTAAPTSKPTTSHPSSVPSSMPSPTPSSIPTSPSMVPSSPSTMPTAPSAMPSTSVPSIMPTSPSPMPSSIPSSVPSSVPTGWLVVLEPVNTTRWLINEEHRVQWTSGGEGERLNLAIYLDGTRLQTLNINGAGVVEVLQPDVENFWWFVDTDFEPSDKYSIRFELNGQLQYQESEMFSLIVPVEEKPTQSSLFEGSLIFTFTLSGFILCGAAAVAFSGGGGISRGDSTSLRVWGLCVLAEVIDLIILLIGWLMFADEATVSCDAMMLSAILIQTLQIAVVFAIVTQLGSMAKADVALVQNFCLAMDVVQTVLYSASEGTCGDGIIISIAVGVGLLLVFLTEYAHIGKLDSTTIMSSRKKVANYEVT
jgi:hypothetical protein